MPPPLIGGGIKRWCCLTSVCLSVAYIGPKSRTERPRKTKIGTEVAHATRDSDTTYKVKRSKVKVTRQLCSLPCWRVRRLQQWAWERVGRGKLLLCCSLLCSARRFGAHGGGEGRGHILAAARLQVVGRQNQAVNEANIKRCPSLFKVTRPVTAALWNSIFCSHRLGVSWGMIFCVSCCYISTFVRQIQDTNSKAIRTEKNERQKLSIPRSGRSNIMVNF